MRKPVVLLLGKLPPPYMGPSIATDILLRSSLKEHCTLLHLDTKAYDDLNELGKWSLKKLRRNFSIYINLRGLIRQHKPDIVWIPISQTTTGFLKDAVFIWIAALSGSKVLLHLRGSNFRKWHDQASRLMKWLVRITFSRCRGIIVLGTGLKKIFSPWFSDDHIYVVPNGGNYTFPSVVKDENKIQLLYLANLQSSKGIEDVLEAIALLHKEFKNYHLHVMGKWRKEETRVQCMKLIGDHGLHVTVHPPASGDEKLKQLAQSDIFLFPPREPEGHPWVIVEALAAGLPVISTDQGAITESVIHERNGFIVEPQRPDQIASCIKMLVNNRELRQRMSAESRIHYLNSFTEEKMVERLVSTFDHVMHH
jgi:glycosyltransferase involved in cell wall biosynthesis